MSERLPSRQPRTPDRRPPVQSPRPVVGAKGFALRSTLALGSLLAAYEGYSHAKNSEPAAASRTESYQGAQEAAFEAPVPRNQRPSVYDERGRIARAETSPLEINIPTGSVEEEEEERQAQADREEEERHLNAPITDAQTIELTGETEGSNLLATGEIDHFLGHPKAFADEMTRRLGEELRAGNVDTTEVARARASVRQVLRTAATEAHEQGQLTRAIQLAQLAGDDENVVRMALDARRPDLAVDAWRQTATEYGIDARLGEHLTDYSPDQAHQLLGAMTAEEQAATHDQLVDLLDGADDSIQEQREFLQNNPSRRPLDAGTRQDHEQRLQDEQANQARIQAILRANFSS